MPTTQEHQNKQSRTQLALSDLEQSQNSPQHADWIVTLAFYKSLHAVDSYFAKLRIHPRGHREREQYVQSHLRNIYDPYLALYQASIRARYKAHTHESQEITRLVNHSLVIEEYINTLLAAD